MVHRQSGIPENTSPKIQYRIIWAFVAIALIVAVMILRTAKMYVQIGPILRYLFVLIPLLMAHLFYTSFRPNIRLSLITGSVGLMFSACLLAGIIANAGLRLRYPLVDNVLAHTDAALGIDTPGIVMSVGAHSWASNVLGFAYESIYPISLLTAIWLSLRSEIILIWEFAITFCGGVIVAAMVATVYPALGNTVHAGLQHLAGTQLPAGAGVFHLPAVEAYRNGQNALLDVSELQGVVTFPSFHMIMALAVSFAFRKSGHVSHPITGWCALVAFSAVPIGGHYIVDLLGGIALWAVFLCLPSIVRHCSLHQFTSPSRRQLLKLANYVSRS